MNFRRFGRKGFSKYGSRKITIEGIQFDSQREGRRYVELKTMLISNEIRELKCHPIYLLQESFKLKGKTYRKIEYWADFEYVDISTGKTIIEDCKGFKTKDYQIKKKLFLKKLPDNCIFMELK